MQLETKDRHAILQELAKRKIRTYYEQHPDQWLIRELGEHPLSVQWSVLPEYETHVWDGTRDPFKRLCEALAAKKNVGIESATSTGKSFFVARLAYWFLEVFDNSLVVTTAPKQQQLKNILWAEINRVFMRYKNVRPEAELFSMRLMAEGNYFQQSQQDRSMEEEVSDHQIIGVVSGVGAEEASATKMQGYHREHMLFILDECAGISPAVLTAVKNTCTAENNLILAVGNPDSITDALHQFCTLPHVEHIRISAFDHPNVVCKQTIIPGAVTPKSIEERRAEYGEESNFYNSRVRGISPKQATDSLILYEWVAAACRWMEEFDHNIIDQNSPDANYIDSENALGMDVANSENGDRACLTWGKRNVVKFIEEFQCRDANALADNVVHPSEYLEREGIPNYHTAKLSDYNIDPWRIAVDAVGVGAGTVNQFYRMHYEIVALKGGVDKEAIPVDSDGVPLYDFLNQRAQIFFQLRLDLMRHEIIFDIDDPYIRQQLIKELVNVKYRISDRSIQIESKEQIKKRLGGKSPNILDSIAYLNWVRKDRGLILSPAPYKMS